MSVMINGKIYNIGANKMEQIYPLMEFEPKMTVKALAQGLRITDV